MSSELIMNKIVIPVQDIFKKIHILVNRNYWPIIEFILIVDSDVDN